jgi:hypothetical protein
LSYCELYRFPQTSINRNIGIEVDARIPRRSYYLTTAATAFHAEPPFPAYDQRAEATLAGLPASACRILVNHPSF